MEILISVAFAFFVIAVSPGPATISVATISMSRGRWAGLQFGLGLSFGLVFWGIIAATGMGAVLQGSVILLSLLKFFGGLYLLWLAFQATRSAMNSKEIRVAETGQSRWFLKGLILNMSNPKSVIAWMAALSIGLEKGAGGADVLAATLTCIAVGFMVNLGYAVVFSRSGIMGVYKKARRWVDGVVAVFFAGAGFGLMRSAVSN